MGILMRKHLNINLIDNNNDKHYFLKVIIEYCIKWQPHDKERATDIQRPAHGLTDGEPVRYITQLECWSDVSCCFFLRTRKQSDSNVVVASITCINHPAFKSSATKARHAKETPWPVIM